MTLPPSTPAVLRDRTQWHLGANAPVVAWLAALFLPLLFSAVLCAVRAKRVGRRPDGLTPVRPARRTGPHGTDGRGTLPKHVPETAAVARGRHARQAVTGWP